MSKIYLTIFLLLIFFLGFPVDISATDNNLPQEVHFSYEQEEEAYIRLCDFPVTVTFDRIPSCKIALMYSSGTGDMVTYIAELKTITETSFDLPSDFYTNGTLIDGDYHIEVGIGFVDDDGFLIKDNNGENIVYSQYYVIAPISEPQPQKIRYTMQFNNEKAQDAASSLEAPEMRLSSTCGRFKFIGDYDQMPASIRKSIDYACMIWAPLIPPGNEIILETEYGPFTDPLVTDVMYVQPGREPYVIPMSLHQLNMNPEQLKPSANIKVSSLIDWDTSVLTPMDETKFNLPTGLSKMIGRILGIGSSIAVNESGQYISYWRFYSNFDSNIYRSDGAPLTSIPLQRPQVPNLKLHDYIDADGYYFYFKEDRPDFILAPGPYGPANPPLSSFETGFMANQLNKAERCLQLDESVYDTLRTIGWDIQSNADWIDRTKTATDKSAIGSGYGYYTFNCDNYNGTTPTGYEWKCSVELKDGTQVTLATGQDQDFIVPPLPDNYEYLLSPDGMVECMIELTIWVNDVSAKATPYTFYRTWKPFIFDANILDMNPNYDTYGYDLTFDVEYRGAERIIVELHGDNVSAIRTWYLNEPYYAKMTLDDLPMFINSWLILRVKNELGSYTRRVEIPTINYFKLPSEVVEIQDPAGLDRTYKAFDLYGNNVWTGASKDDFIIEGRPGIWIVGTYCGARQINVEKIIIQ